MTRQKDPSPITLPLACKLASIVAHVEEGTGPDAHPFDLMALHSLLSDAELKVWMASMRRASLAPLPRR